MNKSQQKENYLYLDLKIHAIISSKRTARKTGFDSSINRQENTGKIINDTKIYASNYYNYSKFS